MNDYEARQEEKRQRYAELADNARAQSAAEFRKADLREEVSGIPFGQPILVGHHSERRHRNAIKKADKAMRRAIEADEKAKYYEHKAETYGRHGISSDDPDAVVKLREKLARLEETQATYKAINRIVRSKPRNEPSSEKIAKLVALGLSEATASKQFEPDYGGRIGIPSYALSNNNANIRRVKDRIAALSVPEPEPVAKTVGDIEYREEDNRVRIIFPGKPPAETRKLLKSHGFRWSPTAGAWQRHRNNAGRFAAQSVLNAIQ